MTTQEILQAFQAGKISLEEAKKALISAATSQTRPAPEAHLQACSGELALPMSPPASPVSSSPHADILPDNPPTRSGELASPMSQPVSPMSPTVSRKKEAIAIVGMAGRYPGARNVTDFWDNLVQGKNSIREIPLSRFDISDFYDPDPAALGKMYCKWLGALDDIEYFDPFFFHLSPAEAEGMDPQQRLFLEEGYKAFEDAGYSPGLLSNMRCGVYVGIMSHEYDLLLHEQKALEMNILGTSSAITAARLAYHLNLKGPAIPIDTACSSSLVATHLACQALWNQEIDMALVGGVSLYLTPGSYVGMCRAGMLSPDGQCKAFDASANGFVPGEGIGALVLKRLADAEANHDQIYGLIIGSGINQDGATNGITAPSVNSQIDLVREIYEKYQIDPESISYVEMHGTGTKLGDPIELEALATVFQERMQRKQYCAIGSVKSNIGHTSAAAGVAGVQKVLLAMKCKKLVPTLHFQQPNPHFDFAASPFYVNTEVQGWESPESIPRRAAVSAFGFSGTNAHLVVEEYIPDRGADGANTVQISTHERVGTGLVPVPTRSLTFSPRLFVLSAKSENQLKSYAQEMKQWIRTHEEQSLSDIAFTCQVGRQAMDYRLAIVADLREVLLQRLEEFVDNQTSMGIYTAQVKKNNLWSGASPTGNDARILEADEDEQSLLHTWCREKKLEKIAQVWVKGVDVDWMLLYEADPRMIPTEAGQKSLGRDTPLPLRVPTASALPQRISLPTYPFARERYWLPTTTLSTTTNPADELLTRPGGQALVTQTQSPSQVSVPTTDEHALWLAPLWDLVILPKPSSAADPTNQVIIVGGTPDEQSTITLVYPHARTLEIPTGASIERLVQCLQELETIASVRPHVFWLAPSDPLLAPTQESILSAQQQGVLACFRLIKALLQLGYASKTLDFTVITRQTRTLDATEIGDPTHASLLGLFGSLAKEYPHWSIRQVDLPIDASLPLAEMQRLPADPRGHGWLYRNGHWYRQILVPMDVSTFQTCGAYRRGGVYVVIGGAGGIGEVWSEYLIRRYQAHIIWIGRRDKTTAIAAKLQRLASIGPVPDYICADATDRQALEDAYQYIKQRYGQVHGVIHAAIVLRDQSLANMDEERFQDALAAKVDVSVRLAQVFEHESLDFVLFFSSINAFACNAGQSNYAAGSTFEDAFAARLGRAWKCQVKVMNWGYWGSVGVATEPVYRERMAQMGVGSIEPEEAMEALEYLLAGPVDQMALLKTTKPLAPRREMGLWLDVNPDPTGRTGDTVRQASKRNQWSKPSSYVTEEMVKDYIEEMIAEQLSELLKIERKNIDGDKPFADFGLDSITGTHLTQRINRSLDIKLEMAHLFDYSSVKDLTAYIFSQYKEILLQTLKEKSTPIETEPIGESLTIGASPMATDDREMLFIHPYRKRVQGWEQGSNKPLSLPKVHSPRKTADGLTQRHIQKDPIAIIGMSGRFAQSQTGEQFWEHISKGEDLIEEVSRWNLATYFSAQTHEKSCNHGSFLDHIDLFDATFFHIPELEASYMDPQQRLFLEESWKALEDAGYVGKSVATRQCGIYAGCSAGDYQQLLGNDPPAQAMQGNAPAVLPARIAYHLNLQGPAIAVDTASSSSLAALHLACQGLWSRETELALAGGVFIQTTPRFYLTAQRAGMLSPTGRCSTFDQQADGFVPGEGVGVVVLKRLEEALADGDHIYGVIIGSGINQDGTTNGMTAPSANSLERLACSVYDTFHINPERLQMMEAYGFSTLFGDPIEVQGLTHAFEKYTQKKEYCAIGSVKTNIGHTAQASGMAGLIKLLLSLKHQQIPPSLHYQAGNPNIAWKESPFYVNTHLKAWDIGPDATRCAAISSIGLGGTNAHMVIEEAPPVSHRHAEKPGYLIALSARTSAQLRLQVEQLVAFCERSAELDCGNISYTLLLGRRHFNHRLACVVPDQQEMVNILQKWLENGKSIQVSVSELTENGRREQPALKRIGDQCIHNCKTAQMATEYLENLSAIAELHVQGCELDLEHLFWDDQYRRISLPTYPFARKRYWVDETVEQAVSHLE